MEHAEVADQLAISRAGFQARFVGPHVFRIVLGLGRFDRGIRAAIEATRLEATIGRHVAHHVVAELFLQAQGRRQCAPTLVGIQRYGVVGTLERHTKNRAGGALVILLLTCVAKAGAQRPAIGKFVIDLAVAGIAVGTQIVVDGAQEGYSVGRQREQAVGKCKLV